MESKVSLSRLFQLRSLSSSCTTTTTATSIDTSAAASNANKSTFITRHRPNLASCSLVAPLLDNRRSTHRTLLSVGCGGCLPTAASPVERAKKKKERTVKESSGFIGTREGDKEGGGRPAASSSSPSKGEEKKEKQKSKTKQTQKKKKKKMTQSTRYHEFMSSFSFESIDDFAGFFSSEEIREEKEVDTKTFFSTKSFSSDSSDFYKKSKKKKKNAEKLKCSSSRRPPRRRRAANTKIYDGFRPLVAISSQKERCVKEEKESGGALAKKSSDPYGDFRSSMVEMIMKRQIFGTRELQRLIHSYLSMNSPQNHPVILRAFADISQVLFSY